MSKFHQWPYCGLSERGVTPSQLNSSQAPRQGWLYMHKFVFACCSLQDCKKRTMLICLWIKVNTTSWESRQNKYLMNMGKCSGLASTFIGWAFSSRARTVLGLLSGTLWWPPILIQKTLTTFSAQCSHLRNNVTFLVLLLVSLITFRGGRDVRVAADDAASKVRWTWDSLNCQAFTIQVCAEESWGLFLFTYILSWWSPFRWSSLELIIHVELRSPTPSKKKLWNTFLQY